MAKVDLSVYEFACLVGKMAKDIGSWGDQNLVWDHEAVEKIHLLSERLAKISKQYLEARKGETE
jgi:hypothetical protein